ncbi:Tannase, partial [Pseudocercospora fuligena]
VPPTCELARIVNATLEFCDPLDGKTDGVVARTDLCALKFDLNTTIGLSYHCAATAGNPMRGQTAAPEQSGAVTAKGAEVAATILKGLFDLQGRRVYIPYQYGTNFVDGATAYNNATGKWEVAQSGLGSEWVERILRLQDANELPEGLGDVTYDTLKDWMTYGLHTYGSPLQTTWPDLAPWRDAGNKILHWHGESDDSIPTASSVRYWDSVREFLYPEKSYNESGAALSEWYKFYSVPGAAHCAPNPNEPNGPFPQTNFQVMIDWVENGIAPKTLNATVMLGEHLGEHREICEWPLRPLWVNDTMECVYDQKSLDTWHYDLDAFQFKIYRSNMATMKALRYHGNKDIRLDEIPIPELRPGWVKIKIAWAGICGSDLHEYLVGPKNAPTTPHPITGETIPTVLGHEFSGTITEVSPDVRTLQPGQKCTVFPPLGDRTCYWCQRGDSSGMCPNWGFLGYSGYGGGFAEYICVDARDVHPLPASVDLDVAALVEPLAVGWHAVKKGKVGNGDAALVLGAGPIGIAVILALRARGVEQVFVSEVSSRRLQHAEDAGATVLLNPLRDDVVERCREATDGFGPHAVFECAGVQASIDTAIEVCCGQGTIVNVGIFEKPIMINPNIINRRQLTYVGSNVYSRVEFDEVIGAIADVYPILGP